MERVHVFTRIVFILLGASLSDIRTTYEEHAELSALVNQAEIDPLELPTKHLHDPRYRMSASVHSIGRLAWNLIVILPRELFGRNGATLRRGR